MCHVHPPDTQECAHLGESTVASATAVVVVGKVVFSHVVPQVLDPLVLNGAIMLMLGDTHPKVSALALDVIRTVHAAAPVVDVSGTGALNGVGHVMFSNLLYQVRLGVVVCCSAQAAPRRCGRHAWVIGAVGVTSLFLWLPRLGPALPDCCDSCATAANTSPGA